MFDIYLAIATHRVGPHGNSKTVEYDINLMEWNVECRDGTKWKFHGDLERRNGAGWPLHHPRSRIDQTMAVRFHEFEPA
jgi:hypothetical protein